MPKPTVFISYCERDGWWRSELVQYLEVLEAQGPLDIWDNSLIRTGDTRQVEIEAAIARASVAVLLISKDFLCSRPIRDRELPDLLARRQVGGLQIFPVIVRPCAAEQVTEISGFERRPRNGRALSDFRGNDRARAMVEIASEIQKLAHGNAESKPSISLGLTIAKELSVSLNRISNEIRDIASSLHRPPVSEEPAE